MIIVLWGTYNQAIMSETSRELNCKIIPVDIGSGKIKVEPAEGTDKVLAYLKTRGYDLAIVVK